MQKALSLPPWLKWADTSAWAGAQDRVIRREAKPSTLAPFEPLCMTQQRANGMTNLVVRQLVLLGWEKEAQAAFLQLVRNRIYIEGYSYFRYCVAAFDRMSVAVPELQQLTELYEELRAPDGTIPLPECRNYPQPLTSRARWYGVRWVGPYLVARTDRLYFLLNMDDSHLHFKRNLHARPATGSFVLWMNGSWVHPPHWYTGFTPESVLGETYRYDLPLGAVPVDWRVNDVGVELDALVTGDGATLNSIVANITYNHPRRFFGLLPPGKRRKRRVELRLDGDRRLAVTDDGKPKLALTGWAL